MTISGSALHTPLKRSSRTLAEEAVDALAAPIHAGQLQPGDKMPTESETMQRLGVSRTVVREAISRLQASGLVETRHGIGTFVAQQPPEDPVLVPSTSIGTAIDTVAFLEVRTALEVEAASLAAQRRTPEQLAAIEAAVNRLVELEKEDHNPIQEAINADFAFHRSIAIATGNAYFLEYLANVGENVIPRSRLHVDADAHQRYLHTLNQEHQLIYRAIKAQDPVAAAEAARNHLLKSRNRLKRAVRTQKGN